MRAMGWLSIASSVASAVVFAVAVRAEVTAASAARVRFLAVGTGMKLEGSTSELTAEEKSGEIALTVPLGGLTTGIGLRDRHMKEKYLEVQKYPNAVLTVARSALKIPASGARVEGDAPAAMLLHGQTRPVTVHYEATGDGRSITTRGTVHVNMLEYGIVVPSYLGVTVKPDVDVVATFQLAGR